MNHSALILSFASVLAFAGCFTGTSEPDPCADTRRCVAADEVGCCVGAGRDISVCQDSCPADMIEETECRMAGCGMGCETPLWCRVDYGSSCCGETVFTTSCDACPAGSVEASACAADYPAECGCGGIIRAFRAPDAEGAIAATLECFEDLGGGCCGAFVVLSSCGECPAGTLDQFNCDMAADRIAPPAVTCREDLGGGCCGSEVAPNACSAECPAGSIEASSCEDISAGDRAFPGPAACFLLNAEGCCGEPVAATACGVCPEGATSICDPCEA